MLLRALARQPAARFDSVRSFAAALTLAFDSDPVELVAPEASVDNDPDDALHSLILEQLRRRVVDPRAVARQDPECRSHSEIYGGQAGLALAALVYAEAELDSDALAAAELWLDAGDGMPSYAQIGRDGGDEASSMMSLFQGSLGPTWTRAAIALSSGDWRRAQPSMTEFDDRLARFLGAGGLSAEPEHTQLDAANGPLSSLLGTACLVYRSRPFDAVLDIESLQHSGDRLYDEALSLLSSQPLQEGIGPLRYLGMAHGSMGALYTLLRWSIERGRHDPQLERVVLDFTEGCHARGGEPAVPPATATPRQPTGGGHRLLPGWCHGAAGHTLFWATAFEALGDDVLRDNMLAAAQHVVEHPASQHGSLCCGLAGQAVALRRVNEVTADAAWAKRADQLARRAAMSASNLGASGLFKGTAGAVLAMLPSDRRASLF